MVAALGALTLTGCRSAPTEAVYIGDERYGNAYVERLNDEIINAVDQLAPQARPQTMPYAMLRRFIVSSLVVRKVGAEIAKERAVDIPAADRSIAATRVFGFEEGSQAERDLTKSEVAKVISEAYVTLEALSRVASSREPTAKEQREVYDTIMESQQVGEVPFEQVQRLFTKENIGEALGLRDLLTKELRHFDVAVNPRYAPLSHQLPVDVQGVSTYLNVKISPR